jgi:hypothetical protein
LGLVDIGREPRGTTLFHPRRPAALAHGTGNKHKLHLDTCVCHSCWNGNPVHKAKRRPPGRGACPRSGPRGPG